MSQFRLIRESLSDHPFSHVHLLKLQSHHMVYSHNPHQILKLTYLCIYITFWFVYFTTLQAYRASVFSALLAFVFIAHCLAWRRGLVTVCSINERVPCTRRKKMVRSEEGWGENSPLHISSPQQGFDASQTAPPLAPSWAGLPTVSGPAPDVSAPRLPLSAGSISLAIISEKLCFLISLIYGESLFVMPPGL